MKKLSILVYSGVYIAGEVGTAVNSKFWTHTIWYVILSFTTFFVVLLIFIKSKNRRFDFGFYFALLGLAYHIEVILLPLLYAYEYFPKLSKDQYLDSLIGNAFSQISVGSTLMLITVYNMSKRWYFLIASIYFLIEKLFLKLDIYLHYWYKSWITYIGIIFLSFLSKAWYRKMSKTSNNYIYFITLYLAVYTISGNIALSFMFNKIMVFNFHIYDNFFRNQGVMTQLYLMLLISSIIMLHKWRASLLKKSVLVIIFFFLHLLANNVGFIEYKIDWILLAPLFTISLCYLSVILMDFLLKHRFLIHERHLGE